MIKKENSFVNDLVMMTGVSLMSSFLLATVIANLLFLFEVSIGPAVLPSAVIVSAVIVYWLSGRDWRVTLCSLLFCVVLIGGFSFISQLTYDYSWDGNAYHKGISGALRYGWNPLKEDFYSFSDNSALTFLKSAKATWYDAYPKASEIWAACLYCLTGKLECGKSFNLLAIAIVFFVSDILLRETHKLKSWQCDACAVFCALNPVILAQVMTFYNDGFLWHMVFICLAALLYLTFAGEGRYSEVCLFIVFAAINIGFNVKFSGVVFFAALCLPFFVFWVAVYLKKRRDREEGRSLLKRFTCLSTAVFSGFIVTGAASYVTNTVRYRNPFYTMIGENSTDLVESMLPPLYVRMPKVLRVFCSVFSRTSNDGRNSKLQAVRWKLPFLFTKDEVEFAQGFDTRIGGWGILFSGILIVSLAVLMGMLWKLRKTHPRVIATASLLFAVNALAIVTVPGFSWARYYVALLYIPVAALVFLFAFSNRYPQRQRYLFISGLLAALLFINFVPNLEKAAESIAVSRREKEALTALKNGSMYSPLQICYENEKYSFYGRIFDLYDAGIRNFEFTDERIPAEERDGTVFNSYALSYRWSDGIKASKTAEEFLRQAEKTEHTLLLITAKDEAGSALTEETIMAFRAIGLEFGLKGDKHSSYYAVLENGQVIAEECGDEQLLYEGQAAGHAVSILSDGAADGGETRISVDGKDLAVNGKGLNLVLYDLEQNRVIDSVCVDSGTDNQWTRK